MIKEIFIPDDGLVLIIPHTSRYILAQVGCGGDLGVFDRSYKSVDGFQKEHLEDIPLFRVHFGGVSSKKYGWIALGKYPLKGTMSEAAPYCHRSVEDFDCFIMQYKKEDILVDCEDFKDMEPLATWSHEHIVERFDKCHQRDDGDAP